MMTRKHTTTGNGLTFLETLLLIFVVLKLVGVITWSWWWVLTPLWISLGIVLVTLGSTFISRLLGGGLGSGW